MNTYYITETVTVERRYVVEAMSEDNAISEVEWGNVSVDDEEVVDTIDIKVDDVEYGEANFVVKVGLDVALSGQEPSTDYVAEQIAQNLSCDCSGVRIENVEILDINMVEE